MGYRDNTIEPIQTVGDLVAALKVFELRTPIAIYDADTDWHLTIEYLGVDKDEHPTRICLGGQYQGAPVPK